MSRKVKCAVTGEIGDSDIFIKIGSHYYKDKEVYLQAEQKKQDRKDLIDYICSNLLNYQPGQPFPTFLTKKLQQWSFYPDRVILENFQQCAPAMQWALENKTFSSDFAKISYLFAIADHHIADTYRQTIQRETRQRVAANRPTEEFTPTTNAPSLDKEDLSSFLSEEELE